METGNTKQSELSGQHNSKSEVKKTEEPKKKTDSIKFSENKKNRGSDMEFKGTKSEKRFSIRNASSAPQMVEFNSDRAVNIPVGKNIIVPESIINHKKLKPLLSANPPKIVVIEKK